MRRVVGLELAGNGLRGPFPAEVVYLSQLEVLDLSNNGRSTTTKVRSSGGTGGSGGSGGSGGGSGQLLEVKSIRAVPHTGVSGSLPRGLGSRLARLRRLDCCNNSLTGNVPGDFRQLFRLELLDLDTNCLTGQLPSAIGGWVRTSLMQDGGCDIQLANNKGLVLF